MSKQFTQAAPARKAAAAALPPDDLILRSERKRLVPLSDATIWRMERRGEFPRRVAISSKRVAWRRSEIALWLEQRTK
jgi:prophage regulatory protein